MRNFPALLLSASVLAAACSAQHGSSIVPESAGGSTSAFGARTAHAEAITAPAGWSATATNVFSLLNATDLGPVSATQSITVVLGLQMQNAAQLQGLVASGQTISPSTFNATYAPSATSVKAVTSYLQAEGFTNVTVAPNSLLVSATAPASIVQTAFDTTLHSFSQSGASAYANTEPAFVPNSLGGIVIAVLGLNDVQTFKTNPHKGGTVPAPTPTPTAQPETPCDVYNLDIVGLPSPQPEPSAASGEVGCLRNYTPSDYWRAYDAMNVPAASNVNVAVMAEGSVSQSISDFRTNETGFGLVQVPVVQEPVGVASTDTSGDDEWTLDMTASSGMARDLKTLYLYVTPALTDSDIALEYNKWVTDDLAKVGNSSFGGCEYGPYLDGSMVLDDEVLLEGAAQGQTMFASAGDSGSFCSVGAPNGIPAGAPFVNYPASSPYVVAVGGTTLATMTDGSYQGEAAWFSGGGGVSQFEDQPAWEASAQSIGSEVGDRGVPDVAMDGDLTTGMTLYLSDEGGWTTIGGTSLSSPLSAGVWARMLQVHGALGFAAPLLYAEYTNYTAGSDTGVQPVTRPYGGFHDILIGSNGAFTALPGYDYTTGLGSFDVGVTSTDIK